MKEITHQLCQSKLVFDMEAFLHIELSLDLVCN